MEQFQTAVKNALKRHNITVYRLSEITGIERSHLVKIVNGQRGISPQKFELLLKSMNLTPDEDKEIRLAYIDMNFGIDKFNEYLNIFLFDEDTKPEIRTPDEDKTAFNFTGNITNLNTHTGIINALYAVTKQETKQNGKKRLYTNIDATLTVKIFDSVKDNITETDIKQIITSKSDLDYSKTVKSAVEFMLKGYKIYYSGSDSDIENRPDIVFPFYFITSELCIFADENLTHGFSIKNKKLADTYAKRISYSTDKMTSIVSLTQNVMDIKNGQLKNIRYKDKTSIIMEFFLCAPIFMTLEMGEQITKNEIPNRKFLIDSTYEYYQALRMSQKNSIRIHSYEGIRDFTDRGMVSYLPEECINPLEAESRIKVYKTLLEYYRSENHDLHISKPGMFKNKITLDISDRYSDRRHVVSSLYGYLINFMGNSNISINDTEINNELADFCRYLTVSPYLYSKEESLDMILREITRLEEKTAEKE